MQTVELSPADHALAAGIADAHSLPSYMRPEAKEAVRVAVQQEKTRLAELCDARATIRKHGIKTDAELQTALNNLIASIDTASSTLRTEYRDKLVQLASDMDDEMHDAGQDGALVSPYVDVPRVVV